jgi:polysaccharide pyruvyl transferase WcaK-like protein
MAMSFRQSRIPSLKDLFTAWNYSDILSIVKMTIPTGLVFLLLQIFQFSTLIFHSTSNESAIFDQVGLNLRVWSILAIPVGILPTAYFSKIFTQQFHIQKVIRQIGLFYSMIVFFSILVMPFAMNILYGYRSTQFSHGVSLYLLSMPIFAVSNILVLNLIGENRSFQAVRALGTAIVCNVVSLSFFNRSIVGVGLSWFMANIVLVVILLIIMRERNQDRTFLISAAGYGNIGDDFILENQLSDVNNDASVSIVCGPLTERIQARRVVQFLTSTRWCHHARTLVAIIRSNSVNFAGGGLFAENGKGYYRPYIRLLLLSILLRKRVTLRAIQVDRLDSQVYRQILGYCLGKVDSSSVRDLISYNNLPPAGKNGFTIADDLVFFKRPSEINLTPISLCINLRKSQDNSDLSESFLNCFATFLNEKVQLTSRVVLLSMMENEFESDSEVLMSLKAKLLFETEIIYPKSTVQAMEIIASSERVIAMRLHCIVFAAMFEKNVLAIPYANKVSSFAKAHGIDCVNTDNFIQPFENWWNRNE